MKLTKDTFNKEELYVFEPGSAQVARALQLFLQKEINAVFLERDVIPFEGGITSTKSGFEGQIMKLGMLYINEEWMLMAATERSRVEDSLTKLTNKNKYTTISKADLSDLAVGDVVTASKGAVSGEQVSRINPILEAAGLPTLDTVVESILKETSVLKESLKTKDESLEKAQQEIKAYNKLKKDIASSGGSFGRNSGPKDVPKSLDGKIPEGKVVFKKAKDVFNIKGKDAELFDFDIPTFEWDGVHPHVPSPSSGYVFRHNYLMQILHALKNNKKAWMAGHTGTGKSTLVKEICARLNWPFMRINFDSDISRMDLIGRDTLSVEGGVTVSKFVEGILPTALVGPYVLLCDEMDFIRADVAYVLQRALEDEGLLLTEDGGRYIQPHDMFRIIATGNTNGQGDDSGIYQGSRPQSMAFLDRFTVWMDVTYLSKEDEKKILMDYVPTLTNEQADGILKYVTEHRHAFEKGEVIQPLSPRGITSLGEAIVTFTSYLQLDGEDSTTEKGKKQIAKALKLAVDTVILNRASPQDKTVLNGIADRVFKDLAA